MKGLLTLLAVAAICVALAIMLWPAADGSQVESEIKMLEVSGRATRTALDNEARDLENRLKETDVRVQEGAVPVRIASTQAFVLTMTTIALLLADGVVVACIAWPICYLVYRVTRNK
jgi:hypothetical protein